MTKTGFGKRHNTQFAWLVRMCMLYSLWIIDSPTAGPLPELNTEQDGNTFGGKEMLAS